VVPPHAGGTVRLVRVDEEQRGQDRIEVGLVLDLDAVLGLDAHDFRDGHAVPSKLVVKKNPGRGSRPGGNGGLDAPPLSEVRWGALAPRSPTGIARFSRPARRSAASPSFRP